MNEPEIQSESSTVQQLRYQPFVIAALAMMSGIGFDRLFDVDYKWSLVMGGISVAGWLTIRFLIKKCVDGSHQISSHHQTYRRLSALGLIMLLIGFFAFGWCWHHGRWNWYGSNDISLSATQMPMPHCIEGILTSELRWMAPVESEEGLDYSDGAVRTRTTIQVTRIRDGANWQRASGKIDLVIHEQVENYRAGDKVRVWGRLGRNGPPTNPGQFDFRSFRRGKGKLAFIHVYHPDSVQVTEPASGYQSQWLSQLRQHLNREIWKVIDDQQASFASAILLGNREQMSIQRSERFMHTGTVHLLAISGLHVGIFASTFFLLFRIGMFSRQRCLWMTIIFVLFYAWLVEFRPPVTRASILIVLFCVGRLKGERSFSYNFLALAGMIVLLLNPMDLFGIGPQLSFLAVGSLIFGRDWISSPPSTDPIKRLIAKTRPGHVRFFYWIGKKFRSGILVSGLIWLVAMPWVAYQFHLVAPVALLINPILLLPVALALYGGLGVLLFGWWLPPVAQVCGEICQINLVWIEQIISFAQGLPMSHYWLAGPSTISVVSFYVMLFFVAVFPLTRQSLKTVVLLSLGWVVFGWLVPEQVADYRSRAGTRPLVCTFVDVGHGTSVLIQLPDGENMLYDAGSLGSSNFGTQNISGVLWSNGIEHLDRVIISHADIDHFNALPKLCEKFSIGEVCLTPQMLDSNSGGVKALLRTLDRYKIPVRIVNVANQLSLTGLTHAEFLQPPQQGTGGNDNANSLVLLLEYSGHKILLPGDLEHEGLSMLLARQPIDCSVIMAAHHGGQNSKPELFAQWSTPEHVVISSGNRRIKKSTVEDFFEQGCQVHRTDLDGAIRVQIDDSGVEIKHWEINRWLKKENLLFNRARAQ